MAIIWWYHKHPPQYRLSMVPRPSAIHRTVYGVACRCCCRGSGRASCVVVVVVLLVVDSSLSLPLSSSPSLLSNRPPVVTYSRCRVSPCPCPLGETVRPPLAISRHHRRPPTPPMPLLLDDDSPLRCANALDIRIQIVFPRGSGTIRISHTNSTRTATHAGGAPTGYGTLSRPWSLCPVRAETDVLERNRGSHSRARGRTRSLRSRAF